MFCRETRDVPVDPDLSYVVNMMINLELSWISEALLGLSVADLILSCLFCVLALTVCKEMGLCNLERERERERERI